MVRLSILLLAHEYLRTDLLGKSGIVSLSNVKQTKHANFLSLNRFCILEDICLGGDSKARAGRDIYGAVLETQGRVVPGACLGQAALVLVVWADIGGTGG